MSLWILYLKSAVTFFFKLIIILHAEQIIDCNRNQHYFLTGKSKTGFSAFGFPVFR